MRVETEPHCMPVCPGCGRTVEVEALENHVVDGVHHVHCPHCGRVLGTYNEHANRP